MTNAPAGPLARLLARAADQAGQPIRLGLERVERLLHALGDPQDALRAVHVAGTNGKGSVIAFLEAILRRAGHSTGCYTSPHLQRFNERIRVNGEEIPDARLHPLLERALAADPHGEATFFELTTAAALLHLADRAPRWSLLETGLGGRLDATNCVTPRLTVITPIALDHQAFLGGTVADIAAEKAGILKPGIPCVADPGTPEAVAVVVVHAARVGAPLHLAGRDFHWTPLEGGRWCYREPGGASGNPQSLPLPPPGLVGPHQYRNAALAVAAARQLTAGGEAIPADALAEGIANAHWPGRMERFPGPPEVWLDGAHNPAGAEALARALDALPPAPTVLLFAAMGDKALPDLARPLASRVARVVTVPAGGARGAEPAALAALWQGLGVAATAAADPAAGLALARRHCPPGGRIVVAGSLFLVGAVRSLL